MCMHLLSNFSLQIAIAGSDYTNFSSTQIFTSGSANGTSKCVDITIIDDFALEEDQTFIVTLTTLEPHVILVVNETTITITDNDG